MYRGLCKAPAQAWMYAQNAHYLCLEYKSACMLYSPPQCKTTYSKMYNAKIHLNCHLYTAAAGPRRVIMQALHTVCVHEA